MESPLLTKSPEHNGLYKLLRRKAAKVLVDKPQQSSNVTQLTKALRIPQIVSIGVGTTIGAGIFILVGIVAKEQAGPSVSLSFLIAGLAAALSAICYAELASRYPSAGSAYHYAYAFLGEGFAWLVGWALVLEYTVGGSTVARGFSPNLALFFGQGELPTWLMRHQIPGTTIVADPCAGLLVVIVTLLLCAGIKESATAQTIMTLGLVLVLLFVILVGSWIGFCTGWQGYKQPKGYFPFGIRGMLSGAAKVFFSYIGFDAVASTAEEVKNPQRDLPVGIGLALFICGSLYTAVSAVIVGIVPYTEMDPDTPISSAFSAHGMPWAMYIVAAGAMVAMLTTLLGSFLPQPRIMMTMSRDGLLPSVFGTVNKATTVPVNSTLVTGLLGVVMSSLMNVDELSGMVSVGTLMAFTAVGLCILVLRYVPPLEDSTTSCSDNRATQPVLHRSEDLDEQIETAISYTKEGSESENSSFPSGKLDEAFLIDQNASDPSFKFPNQETVPVQFERKQPELVEKESSAMWKAKQHQSERLFRILCILSVFGGILLVSITSSITFLASWSRWMIGILGLLLLIYGTVKLLLFKDVESLYHYEHSNCFRCPFVPILPMASIFVNVYLLVNIGISTWMRVFVWLICGVLVYVFYGVRYSSLGKERVSDS